MSGRFCYNIIMTEFQQDEIFSTPLEKVSDFKFDEAVVKVFPDMLKRSIPGYENIIPMIGLIAERYVQAESRVYDLGCSLGAATLAMRRRIKRPAVKMVAVDNSAAMIARCREVLATVDSSPIPVELVEADVENTAVENASVVVLNFTLQFVEPQKRDGVIERIYEGLRPGGVLVLSEKIQLPTAEQDERFVDLYYDFKRANGYSDLEIAQKRTALENVMILDTVEAHQARVLGAGFKRCEQWFQAFNFVSMLAIKEE